MMSLSPISNIHLLQQIAEHSLSAFFIYNIQTQRFDYLNPAFEEIWERPVEQANADLPALLSSVSAEDMPSLHICYKRLLHNALRQSREFRIRLEGGREKWICATVYAIKDPQQGQYLAGFAEDISHTKENELTANIFSTHKNAMLEMMSHDLSGPIGIALQLISQVEKQSRQSGQKEIEERAAIVNKTLQQSLGLIHDYLDYEYLTSSNTALKIQQIELIEQIQAALDGFNRMDINQNKHIRLESSSPQVFVHVDTTKFLQVITNLVSNAHKFTPAGGHIIVQVQEQEQTLLIRVSDDGIGIPASLQETIFDRFTQARRPGLRGEDTTGLGLSIVKRIVEMHKGRIWVESEENKGATFFVEIPYQTQDPVA
jgi:two-component system sensor histidine kinase VicK